MCQPYRRQTRRTNGCSSFYIPLTIIQFDEISKLEFKKSKLCLQSKKGNQHLRINKIYLNLFIFCWWRSWANTDLISKSDEFDQVRNMIGTVWVILYNKWMLNWDSEELYAKYGRNSMKTLNLNIELDFGDQK